MIKTSKIHYFLIGLYIVGSCFGVLITLLDRGFGGDLFLDNLADVLFIFGFFLILVSKAKAEGGKTVDSWIYGVFAFLALLVPMALIITMSN